MIYKGYDVADGEWMSRHVLMEDCPELVLEYDEAHCSIVDGKERWAQEGLIKTNTPEYFKNKVDDLLKKKSVITQPTRPRGRPRGSSRGRGRPRGRARARAPHQSKRRSARLTAK